jgi:hypothetical protein
MKYKVSGTNPTTWLNFSFYIYIYIYIYIGLEGLDFVQNVEIPPVTNSCDVLVEFKVASVKKLDETPRRYFLENFKAAPIDHHTSPKQFCGPASAAAFVLMPVRAWWHQCLKEPTRWLPIHHLTEGENAKIRFEI